MQMGDGFSKEQKGPGWLWCVRGRGYLGSMAAALANVAAAALKSGSASSPAAICVLPTSFSAPAASPGSSSSFGSRETASSKACAAPAKSAGVSSVASSRELPRPLSAAALHGSTLLAERRERSAQGGAGERQTDLAWLLRRPKDGPNKKTAGGDDSLRMSPQAAAKAKRGESHRSVGSSSSFGSSVIASANRSAAPLKSGGSAAQQQRPSDT